MLQVSLGSHVRALGNFEVDSPDGSRKYRIWKAGDQLRIVGMFLHGMDTQITLETPDGDHEAVTPYQLFQDFIPVTPRKAH